jgi:hypothetical protein
MGQDIRIWMEGLTMTQLVDHTRYAGQQRWKNSTAYERKIAGNSLAPHRLSKEEACKRLIKARAAFR